ncbi:MAG: patatin-like phospholipase family protein [Rhodobacteraceae bacterium]|nr:MAG: patatin-like phospholipase family protein [Paracoccaceae bacterium]
MVKRINLALQGGGAHGAFSWGVLDRLLEDDDIEIAGISGTSAGALNGAALKAGMIEGGRDGARANLDWLWTEVAGIGDLRLADWISAMFPAPGLISRTIEYSLPFSFADAATRVFSPYSYGAFYRNPLSGIVERFHYDAVCSDTGPALYVCATNVRSGKIRIFSGPDISTDAILASACLPTVFKAVEIDGEAYWDGGYTGNPALFPLFVPELPKDIVIVNINPLKRDDLPTDAPAILNRINEISFNSSLLRELRAINFVQRLMAEGNVKEGAMKNVLVHMVADDDLMNDLGVATKMVPNPGIIFALKEAGRTAADTFLAQHREKIGTHSSIDLAEMYD